MKPGIRTWFFRTTSFFAVYLLLYSYGLQTQTEPTVVGRISTITLSFTTTDMSSMITPRGMMGISHFGWIARSTSFSYVIRE